CDYDQLPGRDNSQRRTCTARLAPGGRFPVAQASARLLVELDLVAVGICDINRDAVDAVVQVLEELHARLLEACRERRDAAHAKRHVVDLHRLARPARGERYTLVKGNEGAAVRERFRLALGKA